MLENRELRPEHIVLRAHADRVVYLVHSRPDRPARHECVAAGRPIQPGEHRDDCGFAGAVRPQERRASVVHVERHALDCVESPEPLLQVAYLDRRTRDRGIVREHRVSLSHHVYVLTANDHAHWHSFLLVQRAVWIGGHTVVHIVELGEEPVGPGREPLPDHVDEIRDGKQRTAPHAVLLRQDLVEVHCGSHEGHGGPEQGVVHHDQLVVRGQVFPKVRALREQREPAKVREHREDEPSRRRAREDAGCQLRLTDDERVGDGSQDEQVHDDVGIPRAREEEREKEPERNDGVRPQRQQQEDNAELVRREHGEVGSEQYHVCDEKNEQRNDQIKHVLHDPVRRQLEAHHLHDGAEAVLLLVHDMIHEHRHHEGCREWEQQRSSNR
mmetsp:Transcript_3557/g.10967  ORF Transcript_3557/g.10967 Transcript_3557/m.10967 type:complete len:384 (-) Transcript_3557:367-1518(-)